MIILFRTASAPRIANAITISVTLRLAGVNVPYFMVNNIVLNESLVGCNLIRIFVLSPLPFNGVDVDLASRVRLRRRMSECFLVYISISIRLRLL